METQDVPVLVTVAVALLAGAIATLPEALGWSSEIAEGAARRHLFGVLALVAAAVVLGTKHCALDFAFSRDEAMVEFDAAIFAAGQLLARIPPEWQPYASALQPEFRLPVPGDVGWVSSYLPVNAAIRAFLGLFVRQPWVNAFLMVTAIIALHGVARRLWPSRPDAWVVAVLLLATSSQALFMAMTPYAMSAHLALNLVWLWLFLRDTRSSHGAAMLVGFLATGLHQVVFHPPFVAPFSVANRSTESLGPRCLLRRRICSDSVVLDPLLAACSLRPRPRAGGGERSRYLLVRGAGHGSAFRLQVGRSRHHGAEYAALRRMAKSLDARGRGRWHGRGHPHARSRLAARRRARADPDSHVRPAPPERPGTSLTL